MQMIVWVEMVLKKSKLTHFSRTLTGKAFERLKHPTSLLLHQRLAMKTSIILKKKNHFTPKSLNNLVKQETENLI